MSFLTEIKLMDNLGLWRTFFGVVDGFMLTCPVAVMEVPSRMNIFLLLGQGV